MEFVAYLVIVAAAAAIILGLFIVRQGDAEYEFLVDQRTEFKLDEISHDKASFSCQVPFVNKGTQDGTIMDCYPRHLLPQEQYDAVKVSSYLALESSPRDDGYFEALIVPKTTGSAVVITVVFTARQGDIRTALADMVDMSIDIVFQVVGRGRWYISKQRMVMAADEISRAVAADSVSA